MGHMVNQLLELYPHPATRPLRGAYLAHRLHEQGSREWPFIYGNFVSSLDGRIALREFGGESRLPAALGSEADFRLLLELHAQADCLITHGGYLRAIAHGRLDDILQVGTIAGHEDLAEWRCAEGLSAQPAVCIASASLEFELPPSLERHGQAVFVATGEQADAARVRELEQRGVEVVRAGAGAAVEGAALARVLAQRGLRSAFLLAGPRMLETMLRDRVLARLYVTLTHQLLGGERFHTLIEGEELHGAGRLQLRALHLDRDSLDGSGQMFALFEPLESGDG